MDQAVLELLWKCLTIPTKEKHAIFSRVLSSTNVVDQLLSSIALGFAPGLLEVLQASTPPTLSYFKGLPTESHKRWAVYLLVLSFLTLLSLLFFSIKLTDSYCLFFRLFFGLKY